MINKKELKQLVSLLKKIDNPHKGLPQSVFDALCSIVSFAGCELIVINNKKELLLTWRNDKWWRGWHFPGGLLRYRESFKERIQKVAWDELGISITSHKFLFPINYVQGERGHVISLVFLCKTKEIPKDGKFFKKMPKKIINAHKELWDMVRAKVK